MSKMRTEDILHYRLMNQQIAETSCRKPGHSVRGEPNLQPALFDAEGKNADVVEDLHIGRVLADMDRQRGTAG
jgi:hypothetical protein